MIRISSLTDINWQTVEAVAYRNEPVELDEALLKRVEQGRTRFQRLIDDGAPCYGVTTGLGKLIDVELTDEEKNDLPKNILRARAAATGPPLPRAVARATLFLRLTNFLSSADGVSAALCEYLVNRLNDDFVPWIPSRGHGMAADATAHTHAFQTFIGEGFVFGENNERVPAKQALKTCGVAPYRPGMKEGLALLNGIATAPAYAFDAHHVVSSCLKTATLTAAMSVEALAAPKDSIDPAIIQFGVESGVAQIINELNQLLDGSAISPVNLQVPVSYRVIPQVHGALYDALAALRTRIEQCFVAFSDNPLMVSDNNKESGRFLSVGVFHNQHLVNQVEQVALAFAHVGCLSERRLHRLLDAHHTGLNPQLAPRPGLDAGMVVAHKAALDFSARLKLLAQPVSLLTGETSGGQEDYMSLAIPAIQRLYEMVELAESILAYEMLTACVALDQRNGIAKTVAHFHKKIRYEIPSLDSDRSPGPDVEILLQMLRDGNFEVY